MLHEPAEADTHVVEEAAAYKQRLGLIMLAIYGTIYVVFIILNVATPKTMGTHRRRRPEPRHSLRLRADRLAFLLALAYNWACTRHEKSFESEGKA